MVRLALGSVLLVGTLLTGWLAGNTGEERVRSVTHYKTIERTVEQPAAFAPAPRTLPAPREGGVASGETKGEGSPEASELVDRMRRHLPRFSEWQAEEVRRFHAGYRQRFHEGAVAVTDALMQDRESQRAAVASMRELRRERRDFLRSLLGGEDYGRWAEIERTGGRDVAAFVQQVRERGQGETK